ncbi:homogentisate 1,2-dioxygenase [Microdochium bolleyi]|uniref:homogentisate 1,2-dioxygenase n=1 Tax=Microdochium bolleyi TaxID=196109 RepID=A0A136IVY7_9PEZI|nr:homogentisate 1,2-dioxygenase [Microdochium bolleyi]
MPPFTDFAVKDPYTYLSGFGNYHSSEALPGAVPQVNNSPQIPPLGLRTERISGSAFTAPRERTMQTFLYRAASSLAHSEFVPLDVASGFGPDSQNVPKHLNPNSLSWTGEALALPETAHWINGQQLVGCNGDPARKEGIAVWMFSITEDMPERHVFSSLDGEMLIVPQSGSLDITTEMGKMMVRQNEIAVVPRNVRHQVRLVGGRPCKGYICELFQGHFQLPQLGIIGSTGLANVRDFQIPTAYFDGEWTIVSRLATRRWHATQGRTPFDVAGWHGTCYPYKYDLGRFCVMGNLLFDEHDPCLFTVLSAPNHAASPGTAVVDFAIIPPRYMVAEDTMWLPYYHRNTMQEFYAPITGTSSNRSSGNRFRPFAGGLHGAMSTHGPGEAEFQAMRAHDTRGGPQKVGGEVGVTVFLFETERPLVLSDWALGHAIKNPQEQQRQQQQQARPTRTAKM